MAGNDKLNVVADLSKWGDDTFDEIALVAAKAEHDADRRNVFLSNAICGASASPRHKTSSIALHSDATTSSAAIAETGCSGAASSGSCAETACSGATDKVQAVDDLPIADGALRSECWVDFHPSAFPRCVFHVPLQRRNGIATILNPRCLTDPAAPVIVTVPEKALDATYLTLKERVEYRKRVHLFSTADKHLLFYPAWDLDGPDLPYFGEWKPKVFDKTTAVEAGPWILDGKMLVADMKDRVLQMVEVCMAHGIEELCIVGPFRPSYSNQRGWNMQKGPFMAFWSGVRKAAEILDTRSYKLRIVAQVYDNPYEGLTHALPNCLMWQREASDSASIRAYAYPIDGFSSMCWNSFLLAEIAKMYAPLKDKPALFMESLQSSNVRVSQLQAKHRHPVWNPIAKLRSLR